MRYLTLIFFLSQQTWSAPSNEQLVVGINQEFDNFNPVISQMAASWLIQQATQRSATGIDADWEKYADMITRIPSLKNGDAKIITENGKKKLLVTTEIVAGAKWGDGTPVTAEDCKLTWVIGKHPNTPVGDKESYELIEDVVVDPKNPRKFQTKYKEIDYRFDQLHQSTCMPSKIEKPIFDKSKDQAGGYEKQTAYNTDPTNPGLYNGAYLVKEVKLGSHVTLVPNPHFYGKKPAIQKIIFKLYTNTQALEAAMEAGSIDMISEMGINFDQAIALEKRIAKNPDLKNKMKLIFEQGMTYEHADINLRDPILKDLQVRKALLYGLDREKLVQALFEGKQKVALHFNHPRDVYYTEDVQKYSYDPSKAEETLEQAGWKKGSDGIRAKDGKRMTFTIMTTAENKTRELVEVFIQDQWKKIGAELKIKNEPARVFFGETVRKANYPHFAMYAWISAPDQPPFTTLHTKQIPAKENGFKGQNSGGYSSSEVDKSLDSLRQELDVDKRKVMMKKIIQAYASDLPVIPLYLRTETVVVPPTLKGFRVTGHLRYSTAQIENWHF